MASKQAKPPKALVGIVGIGGPAASAASPAQTESPAQVGRPPGSTSIDYTDMDPLIDYWLKKKPGRFTQKVLIAMIQHFYEQKSMQPPGDTTVKKAHQRTGELK
jgi:hypothetical protein